MKKDSPAQTFYCDSCGGLVACRGLPDLKPHHFKGCSKMRARAARDIVWAAVLWVVFA